MRKEGQRTDVSAPKNFREGFQFAARIHEGMAGARRLLRNHQAIVLDGEAKHGRTAERRIEGLARGFETFTQARVVLMIEPHGVQQSVQRAQK